MATFSGSPSSCYYMRIQPNADGLPMIHQNLEHKPAIDLLKCDSPSKSDRLSEDDKRCSSSVLFPALLEMPPRIC